MALLLAAGQAAAHATGPCRSIEGGRTWAEWLDGMDQRGARLLIRDQRWTWGTALVGATMACPSCPGGDIAKGVVNAGLTPLLDPATEAQLRDKLGQQAANRLEFVLHPEVIGTALSAMINFTLRAVTPVTDALPATLAGMSGKGRAISINSAGNVLHGVAVAAEEGCFSFWGVFFREDNGPVSVDDLRQVDAAVVLQRYRPAFTPAQLGQRPTVVPWRAFPLGDARQQWESEQQHPDRRQ